MGKAINNCVISTAAGGAGQYVNNQFQLKIITLMVLQLWLFITFMCYTACMDGYFWNGH